MEETTESTEPLMDLSDPVFDDMAMSDMTDREQFRSVFFETFNVQFFPDEFGQGWTHVVFEDWKVLLSLLLQIGYWDIQDKQAAQNSFPITTPQLTFYIAEDRVPGEESVVEFEEGSRIWLLIVKGTRGLPKGFHRLDRLECLDIGAENMKSLPLQELNSTPKLFRLALRDASKVLSDSLCGLPETEKLTRVTSLTLSGVHSLQLLHICPSVRDLKFEFNNPGNLDAILNFLGSIELEKLRSIEFSGSKINGEQKAKIVLEIVPRFPNLEKLNFERCCDITDFRVLSNRLRSGKSLAISKSLRSLYIGLSGSTNPAFKADMLTLLNFFPTIDRISFGYHSDDEEDLRTDPDFRYALVKNLVGRRIVERGSGSGSRLPLSAWPIVLQRVQRKWNQRYTQGCYRFSEAFRLSDVESGARLVATGIYYLLREGPALIGRRDLVVVVDDGGGPERSFSPPPCSKRQKRA